MTHEQFKNLKEGDVIRNRAGCGFHVLCNASCVVTIINVGSENACDWSLVSGLTPVPGLPAPQKASDMVLALESAGFKYSDSFGEGRWVAPCGGLFVSLKKAFSSLNSNKYED